MENANYNRDNNSLLNPKIVEFLNPKLIERERLIWKIAQQIRNTTSITELFQTTVNEVKQFLSADRVIIYRFNADWTGQVVAEAVDEPWINILGREINDPCLQKNWVEIYTRGGVKAIANVNDLETTRCYIDLLEEYQVKANLVMPIVPVTKGEIDLEDENSLIKNKLWGLLIVHHCSSPRQWDITETEILPQLAIQVAIAIQQAQKYQELQILTSNLASQVQEKTLALELTHQTLQTESQKSQQLQEELAQLMEEHRKLLISRTSPLIGTIIKDLQEKGHLSDSVMFSAGKELAQRLRCQTLTEFLNLFKMMGLGELTLVENTSRRWKFIGTTLVETKSNSDAPTCHYVRGYICGAIGSLQSTEAVAVETACQSMGDARCEFIVQLVGT